MIYIIYCALLNREITFKINSNMIMLDIISKDLLPYLGSVFSNI